MWKDGVKQAAEKLFETVFLSAAPYRTVQGCAQDDTRGEFFRSL
jgi:hypothetical protein